MYGQFGVSAMVPEVVRIEVEERLRESERQRFGQLAARLLKEDIRRRKALRRMQAKGGIEA